MLDVDGDTADLRVEVDELRRRDLPLLERVEAELHADVGERQPAEAVADLLLHRAPVALRPRPEDVDHVVGHGAADAVRIGLGVVVLLGRDAGATVVGHAERRPVDGVEDDRVDVVGMALDGADRHRVPRHAGRPQRRVLEVATQEVVGGELLARGPRVRERALRQDPLVEAGIGVGDLLLRE